MKSELTMITPAMARQMLECNVDNRKLREGLVEKYRDIYLRGDWLITHQGIAFSESGRLLDGQHRLTFISELPESTQVPIFVSTGMPDRSFEAIDLGRNRSVQDIYKVAEGLAAVGRFFALIVYNKSAGLTPQMVKPLMDFVEDDYTTLVSFSPASKKFWSCATLRAAAIYQMKRGHDKDRIRLIYDSMVKSNISTMTNGARVFTQQYLNGLINARNAYDTFCRATRVFDTKEPFLGTKISIRDQAGEIGEVRKFFTTEVKKNPGFPGLKVAKPSTNVNWKKAA